MASWRLISVFQHLVLAVYFIFGAVEAVQGTALDSVRLTGANGYPTIHSHRGRVEVFQNGDWRSICGDFWRFPEAIVTCRQLGFSGALAAEWFDGRPFPVYRGLYGEVSCNGTELTLDQCHDGGMDQQLCSTYTASAGVKCLAKQTVWHCNFNDGNCSFQEVRDDDSIEWRHINRYMYAFLRRGQQATFRLPGKFGIERGRLEFDYDISTSGIEINTTEEGFLSVQVCENRTTVFSTNDTESTRFATISLDIECSDGIEVFFQATGGSLYSPGVIVNVDNIQLYGTPSTPDGTSSPEPSTLSTLGEVTSVSEPSSSTVEATTGSMGTSTSVSDLGSSTSGPGITTEPGPSTRVWTQLPSDLTTIQTEYASASVSELGSSTAGIQTATSPGTSQSVPVPTLTSGPSFPDTTTHSTSPPVATHSTTPSTMSSRGGSKTISSSPGPTYYTYKPTDDQGVDSQGLGAGGIAAVSIALILLIAAGIAVAVFVLHRQQRGTPSKNATYPGAGAGAGAGAFENPTYVTEKQNDYSIVMST